MKDQTAPYLAAIVIVMFLSGCVLIAVKPQGASRRDRMNVAGGAPVFAGRL